MNMEEKKKRIISLLRSVLISSKEGIKKQSLIKDYELLTNEKLSFKDIGYSSLDEFISSIPDVVKVERKGPDIVYFAVADASIEKLKELVSKQKSTKRPCKINKPRARQATIHYYKTDFKSKEAYQSNYNSSVKLKPKPLANITQVMPHRVPPIQKENITENEKVKKKEQQSEKQEKGVMCNSNVLFKPIDLELCAQDFSKMDLVIDDLAFNQAILIRNQCLYPSLEKHLSIVNLVTKVTRIIDNLTVSPSRDDFQIEETREVGSFKKGTMLAGHNIADIVVILKSLPTTEAVIALMNQILEEMVNMEPYEVRIKHTSSGSEISCHDATINILIATNFSNLKLLKPDFHIDIKLILKHLASIRHCKWFEENVSHASIKFLIRVLRDIRTRYPGFKALNPWMIDLLAHYSIRNNPTNQLPMSTGLRYVLDLLARGFFFSQSEGIIDPCEEGNLKVHSYMTLDQQYQVCNTAQELLRILHCGKFKQILGLENNINMDFEIGIWHDECEKSKSIA